VTGAEEWIWLHTTLDLELIRYRQTEGPVMIVHGMKWKCEGPCQAIDIEMASVSTVG
jgi:hypothetical protein